MSLNHGSGGVLGRIVLVCGALTASAGALILVLWAIGRELLTAMGTGYIPMAPNSALLFALLGSAVVIREVWPASRAIRRGAAAVALFSAVLAGVTLIGFAIDLNIDDLLFRTTRMLGKVPIGQMSPVTAFCFALAGVSLLLLEYQARTWAAILGTLITLVGSVCLIGYWFGAPLLYGGTLIPVALPTSLALVALGAGLTAAAGPHTWPLNTLIGPSTRARLLRALLPTVVLLALLKDWISTILLGHSDPGTVLAAAVTAVSFLLVVSCVVFWVSRVIGDALDRSEAERKRAQEQVQRLANMLDESLNEIYVFDAETLKFQMVNRGARKNLGYSMEELSALTPLDLKPEYTPESFAALIRPLWTGEQRLIRFTSLHRRKDGSTYPVEVHLQLFSDTSPAMFIAIILNITERKQAEEALRTSEALLSNAVKMARLGHWEYDVAKDLFTFNDHFYMLLRTTAEREGGYTMSSTRYTQRFIHPDDLAVVGREIQQALETTDPHYSRQLEHRVVFGDGENGYVTVRLFIVKDNQGRTIKTYGVNQDITERKRTEEELKKREQQLSLITDNFPGFVANVDRDLRYRYANAGYKRILGVAPEAMIGRTIREIVGDEAFKRAEPYIKRALAGEQVSFENLLKKPSGVVIHVLVSLVPEIDAAGKVEGIYIVSIDISERKRAEEALRTGEQRMRLATEAAEVGIWEWNVETNGVRWDTQMFRIYGIAPTEEGFVDYSDWSGAVLPEDLPQQEAVLQDTVRRLGHSTREFRIRRRSDGEIRVIQAVEAVRANEKGGAEWVVGTNRDITERKRAEEQLQQQLKELVRWQSVMLGREDRVRKLKQEINELLVRLGEPIRYPSQTTPEQEPERAAHGTAKPQRSQP